MQEVPAHVDEAMPRVVASVIIAAMSILAYL
jgi:hypothetical protein